VTGMTPSLHRAEAETIFEVSGGLVEVADTYDALLLYPWVVWGGLTRVAPCLLLGF
jgi:hypothetical protein